MQKKILMSSDDERHFDEIFELFVVSKTASGVSDATLRNYHYHMKSIERFLDTKRPMNEITKRDVERMVVEMKKAGINKACCVELSVSSEKIIFFNLNEVSLINNRPAKVVKLLISTNDGPGFIMYQLRNTLKPYGIGDSIDLLAYKNEYIICNNHGVTW